MEDRVGGTERMGRNDSDVEDGSPEGLVLACCGTFWSPHADRLTMLDRNTMTWSAPGTMNGETIGFAALIQSETNTRVHVHRLQKIQCQP